MDMESSGYDVAAGTEALCRIGCPTDRMERQRGGTVLQGGRAIGRLAGERRGLPPVLTSSSGVRATGDGAFQLHLAGSQATLGEPFAGEADCR